MTEQKWVARPLTGKTVIFDTKGEIVATVNDAGVRANLIAAAPDLYAALNALSEEGYDASIRFNTSLMDDAIDSARAALAKARGE